MGLDGVKLEYLNMEGSLDFLDFGDGAFEQIIAACVGVVCLNVKCCTNSQYTALAALLRNPLLVLRSLRTSGVIYPDFEDEDMAVSKISESLVGNTKLRELSLDFGTGKDYQREDFDMVLCNSTTLQNICNSNHTLEHVNHSCTSFTSECLNLNRNENKNIVIQNKVMQFYFVGSFDLAPFASMPLPVLAKVMSVGEEMRNKQTAIFELLRGLPELCNVSSRRELRPMLDLTSLQFREDNGAFERIVSACVRLEELRVNCERNSQFTALAALLQNPLSMLQILTIGKANEHDADLGVDFDEDTVVSEILESLVGNTKLRELWFECVEHEEDIEEIDFDENEFLCNSTTLQNICNSNHTLEKVWIGSPKIMVHLNE
jgi:hypothetical protein